MHEKRRRIGICGGTFDPVHYAHLIMAEEVREMFELEKVIFIPTGLPPHKDISKVTDAEHRYNMVCRAVQGNPFFEVSRIELDRKGYTYTIDTLLELREYCGLDAEILFIIGADIIPELVNWKHYEKVFTMCEFAATLRPGFDEKDFVNEINELKDRFGARIHIARVPNIEISSTMVRQRIASGKSVRYLIPEAVLQYINENNLYT